jgi:hypothetical protein
LLTLYPRNNPLLSQAAGRKTACQRSKSSLLLNEKLDLAAGQQARIRPILQHLHDATQNVMQDQNLSREERLAKVRPQRQIADKKMRAVLSDEQRKNSIFTNGGRTPRCTGV